jgi:hypothetical protein
MARSIFETWSDRPAKFWTGKRNFGKREFCPSVVKFGKEKWKIKQNFISFFLTHIEFFYPVKHFYVALSMMILQKIKVLNHGWQGSKIQNKRNLIFIVTKIKVQNFYNFQEETSYACKSKIKNETKKK